MTALRFSAGSTRFSVCMMWALMMRAAVRLSRALHRLDQRDMLGDELRRVMAFHVRDADAHQPVGLADQVAQRRRHPAVAGGVRQRAVEGAVVGDELFMIAGEAAELVERPQGLVISVFDRFGDAGRLQREAKSQAGRAHRQARSD